MNKQDNNVGNRGDVLKHRLLVDTMSYLARCLSNRHLTYIDTHAYAFDSLIPAQNKLEVVPRWPDDLYFALERERLARGRYLCSPGLAFVVSGFFAASCFIICELDEEYQARLAQEFEKLQVEGLNSRVATTFRPELLSSVPRNELIYMLIDPFEYNRDPAAVEVPVSTVSNAGKPAIVQLFNYGNPVPEHLLPRGWKTWSCNESPYYNSLMLSPDLLPVIDVEHMDAMVEGILK